MSTRSQIGFYREKENPHKKFEALVYRHSDGYPEGVLTDIIPFLLWWNKTRGINDLEYVSARLLQYLCNESDLNMKNLEKQMGKSMLSNTWDFTGIYGHGISNAFHGDIEYFYKVYPNGLQVYSCGFDEAPPKWKLLITIDLNKEVDIKQAIKICKEVEESFEGETTK